ncbi:GPW/gp25 family protein [Candidatus Cytomitobacter primus]|uniref:IraD/Gp25-like domain-containing protein n=1 Tax=Candidatus Cytomitobacter primus TaxID=2066024 RepID=A0A5C0UG75_9PROT|nr:hypothetical protein [Candidatus Cytomitobacter primus]QEK38809.1 hypothetical protein FZC34_02760 [Candidatus Cytomitobacter primus]
MKPALFERIQENPIEKYETAEDLYNSIFHEILCVLDKQSISSSNVKIYSLFPNINPHDKKQLQSLSIQIQNDIQEYEPRLINPTVSIGEFNEKQHTIALQIKGSIRFNDKMFVVKFNPYKRILQ